MSRPYFADESTLIMNVISEKDDIVKSFDKFCLTGLLSSTFISQKNLFVVGSETTHMRDAANDLDSFDLPFILLWENFALALYFRAVLRD